MNISFKIIAIIMGVAMFAILARVGITTTINNNYYKKHAQKNTTKIEVLTPPRGHILDRNNEIMAVNELGFAIAIAPRLKKVALEEQVALIVSHFPQLDSEKLIKTYTHNNTSYNHSHIVVVDFIDYATMQSSYAYLHQSPFISVQPSTKRFYPNFSSASHIIGYVAKANQKDIERNPMSQFTKVIGKSGIESKYNSFLQGDLAYRKVQINAVHKEIRTLEEPKELAQNNLNLTIDLRIQELIDSEFADKEGAVIVMDAHNGEILAAGSYPEYNLNDFVDGISHAKWKALLENPHLPLVNKLVSGQYPPGSVVKMAMGLIFLEYANISERTIIDTPCFIELAGRKYRDWRCGHGQADLLKAIRSSVDVYFYKLSLQTGIGNISSTLMNLGFGQKTGIDIPFESSGVVPNPEWKLKVKGEPWVMGDLINTSIGQGYFLVTPMQIARHTALLASGKLVTPHFALLQNGSAVKGFEPQFILNEFELSKLPILRKGMYQVCNSADGGTAYWRTRGSNVTLACKTGTAQVTGIAQDIKTRIRESEMEYFSRSHAWLTAFMPYENPKYVVTIMIEHGGSGGSGGPVLVNIANKMKELGYF